MPQWACLPATDEASFLASITFGTAKIALREQSVPCATQVALRAPWLTYAFAPLLACLAAARSPGDADHIAYTCDSACVRGWKVVKQR